MQKIIIKRKTAKIEVDVSWVRERKQHDCRSRHLVLLANKAKTTLMDLTEHFRTGHSHKAHLPGFLTTTRSLLSVSTLLNVPSFKWDPPTRGVLRSWCLWVRHWDDNSMMRIPALFQSYIICTAVLFFF